MIEGFLVFYVYLFVSVGSCPSSDLHRFVNLSYELELTGFKFKMDYAGLYTCTCRSPNVFSTDRCWQNTAGASSLTPKEGALVVARKEQTALQICFKPWVIRRCWKRWVFMTVRRSQQGRGKKFRTARGRSCGGHRASQRGSCGVFVAMGNWKAGPKGIHADMIRVKGEKRRMSDDQEDTSVYGCLMWHGHGLCIIFVVFHLLVQVDIDNIPTPLAYILAGGTGRST